jgi:hypothetical protein
MHPKKGAGPSRCSLEQAKKLLPVPVASEIFWCLLPQGAQMLERVFKLDPQCTGYALA